MMQAGAAKGVVMRLGECEDIALVGGKAANLGKLIRAGFPVPGGFVVTTEAFRAGLTPEIAAEVVAAYEAMGSPPPRVAVRSSATSEDMADASMAGQYETYLNIEGRAALLEALRKCWESVHSARTRAYFDEHGLDGARVAMAAVVQRLVEADAAGVLFTANPTTADRGEMLIEASWGLGEMVVSGRVQPDIVRLDAGTGAVHHITVADKHVRLMPGAREEEAVPEELRRAACLGMGDLEQLWRLGRKAAANFGAPQDLEWAKAGDTVYLLQSRPITTLAGVEALAQLKRITQDRLKTELARGRGPWVIHNLAETLSHPTPLTWSVVGRFMTGAGGYGTMYREAGYMPSEKVMREGFLELIGGKVYMDLARAPEMFFHGFPFAYDTAALKRMPEGAGAPTVPTGTRATLKAARGQLAAAQARLREVARTLDRELVETLFPEISTYVAQVRQIGLGALEAEALLALWVRVEEQVMGQYGPKLLLPSLVSGMALQELQEFLAEAQWEEDPAELAQRLSAGGAPSRTVLADEGLYQVGMGKRAMAEWLGAHGHRATGEFDLAAPRWREKHEALLPLAASLAQGESPEERHDRQARETEARAEQLRRALGPGDRAVLERKLEAVRRYMTFREDAKDVFMLAYDLLRALAVESGKQLGLRNGDVFFLLREELFAALQAGKVPAELVELRKRNYQAEERLELPAFIDGEAVRGMEQGGDAVAVTSVAEPGGRPIAVSAGRATGPVLVLRKPGDFQGTAPGYVLVCPSTDPSWTPLFANAAALVLERGGTLSHGAVVAREMGLPAVVLAEATKRFQDGELVTVDGTRGWVGKAEEPETGRAADPGDPALAWELAPPGAGRKDRRAARVRNVMALGWAVYLVLAFGLPAPVVLDPSLAAMDAVLWPLVRVLGKPGMVAATAACIALAMLVLQKLGTDNARLLEAKRRAGLLKKEAATLPGDSVRRGAMERAAAGVAGRTLAAALFPIGLLLGPLVLPFVWFGQRVDPSVAMAPAGTAVQVVAQVEAGYAGKIALHVPGDMSVDAATPAERTVTPMTATLERLMAAYRQSAATGSEAPPLPAGITAAEAVDRLREAMQGPLPTRGVMWLVRPAETFEGRFTVEVRAGQAAVPVRVGLGERLAPLARRVKGASGSTVKEVGVVYVLPAKKGVFWEVAGWNVEWPWVYVLAYLPVLVVGKRVLRVA